MATGVNIKDFYTRIQLKHDTETNWKKIEASFKPLPGEVIIYDADNTYDYPRIKIGDGNKFLSALNFLDDGAINEMAAAISNLSLEGTSNKIILKGTGAEAGKEPAISVVGQGATTATVTGNVLTITSTDSDENVKRTANTGSTALPLVFAPGTGAGTGGVYFNTGVTVTPSSKTITATTFKGDLDGNAKTATNAVAAETAGYADTAGEAASAGQAGSVVGTLTLKSGDTTKTYNGSGNVEFSVTASSLGLSGAMHFLGTSTTAITDGGNENPTIGGSQKTPAAGDVVLYGNQEFVYTSNSKWELLGDEGSYALKSVQIVAGDGLDGGGPLTGDVTIDHEIPTGAKATTKGGSGKYISGVTTDKFGHVTAFSDETLPTLSKGTTTGTGNAVTDISVSGHKITLTKGETFATSAELTTIGNSYPSKIEEGTTNGTISVTVNGTASNVKVKGLGTAAYKDEGYFALKVHDSDAASTYGASTASKFGHVKLTDVYTGGETAANSVALSPKALADFAANAEQRPFHTVTTNNTSNWVTFNCGTSTEVI